MDQISKTDSAWKGDESGYLDLISPYFLLYIPAEQGFLGSSAVTNPPSNAGDATGAMGSIPGSGRSPGEGNGNPLQYSCLENPTDRGARWTTVFGVTKELDTI